MESLDNVVDDGAKAAERQAANEEYIQYLEPLLMRATYQLKKLNIRLSDLKHGGRDIMVRVEEAKAIHKEIDAINVPFVLAFHADPLQAKIGIALEEEQKALRQQVEMKLGIIKKKKKMKKTNKKQKLEVEATF
jgi:hypothetical protein